MFANRELTRIEARKDRLLAQSAAHRSEMSQAVSHLRREASWIETGYEFFLKARSAASFAVPAAGFISALRGHGLAAWIARITSAVRLFGRLKSLLAATAAREEPRAGEGI